MQALHMVDAAQRLGLLGHPCTAAQLRGLDADGALLVVQNALAAMLKAAPPLPESRSAATAVALPGILMLPCPFWQSNAVRTLA